MNDQIPKKTDQHFKLYVVRKTKDSMASLRNIQAMLDEHIPGAFRLDIIDVFESPEEAEVDKIVAVPTLIRVRPEPVKRLIGDLSDKDQVCCVLEFAEVPIG